MRLVFYLFILLASVSSFAPIPVQPVRSIHARNAGVTTSSTKREAFIGHVDFTALSGSMSNLLLSQEHHHLLKDAILSSPKSLLESYGALLREEPLKTKATTAAILACAGDAIAQFRSANIMDGEEEKFSYDARRGAAFLAFGAMYTGAFQHYWFDFLNSHIILWGVKAGLWGPPTTAQSLRAFLAGEEWWRYFDFPGFVQDLGLKLQNLPLPPPPPPSDPMLAASKVAVNQFVVVPSVYMPLFFGVTGALGGLDMKRSLARAQSLFVPLLKRNYIFWLPMQFLQFFVLPVEWQIPFISAASLCWTVILSSIGGSTETKTAPSSVVAYETVPADSESPSPEDEGDEVVMVLQVDAGAANEVTDSVRVEDVRKALVPDAVEEALTDANLGAGAQGLALGLLTSAADDAAIGETVGAILGAEADVGVAVIGAIGAGVGLLAAAAAENINAQEQASSTEDDEMAIDPATAETFHGEEDIVLDMPPNGEGETEDIANEEKLRELVNDGPSQYDAAVTDHSDSPRALVEIREKNQNFLC